MLNLKRIFSRTQDQAPANLVEAFDQARKLAGEESPRQVILVRSDLSLMRLACPAAGSMPREVIDQMEAIVPSAARRTIAVIAPTQFAAKAPRAEVGTPEWTAAGAAIPFFGILNGLAYIGHSVWIFDSRTVEIQAGCREADVLIVDGEMARQLTPAAFDAARQGMRGSEIYVHDRASFQLRPLVPKTPSIRSWASALENARRAATQGPRPPVVLVQPDQTLLRLPCIPIHAMTVDHLAQARRIVPEGTTRNIAVIAPTKLIADPADDGLSPALAQIRAAGRTIPFFGLLLNLASAGNPMWIFDGRPEALEAGCRQTDLLFIDSAMSDQITKGALDAAARVMRSENIVVYDRNSRKLAFIRQVGKTPDKLEFRD